MVALRILIELDQITPLIWREVIVPTDTSLDEFHAVIQGAMAWQDVHIHTFEIAGQKYESPDEEGGDVAENCMDERKFKLAELLKSGDQFTYLYDLGDDWRHTITVVEEITEQTFEGSFPCCVDGAKASPPEDFGGIHTYNDFLTALANSDHEDHDEAKDCAITNDPDVFSVSQGNALVGINYVLCKERKGEKLSPFG